MSPHRNILMVAFPGARVLDITGPLQMFAAANEEVGFDDYRLTVAAPQAGPFATSSGLRLVADMAIANIDDNRLTAADTVVVAGGSHGVGGEIERGEIVRVVGRH